ncbi:hypothetical protein [uncultured Pseudoteredinibacter sp.]|uniref:RipA family octameric membrane protein n=1 Tax=uncultured Pseudoteredinibacter sp. TaxID=1641701 RepID=UPI002627E488|nr:hypothetical protein [uncultured Pseudoteredinibacter sp.]
MDSRGIELYKLYVELADRVSERRLKANTFFLSINSFLIALAGLLKAISLEHLAKPWSLFVCAAGIAMCYFWYRLILSYKGLNTAKFKVIHDMEAELELKPFDAEWVHLESGENDNVYKPLTHIELNIPRIFIALYVVILTWSTLELALL